MCFFSEHAAPILGFVILGFCLLTIMLAQAQHTEPNIPLVGVRSQVEAGIVSNFRFYRHAETILVEGYQKVSRLTHLFLQQLLKVSPVQRADLQIPET